MWQTWNPTVFNMLWDILKYWGSVMSYSIDVPQSTFNVVSPISSFLRHPKPATVHPLSRLWTVLNRDSLDFYIHTYICMFKHDLLYKTKFKSNTCGLYYSIKSIYTFDIPLTILTDLSSIVLKYEGKSNVNSSSEVVWQKNCIPFVVLSFICREVNDFCFILFCAYFSSIFLSLFAWFCFVYFFPSFLFLPRHDEWHDYKYNIDLS